MAEEKIIYEKHPVSPERRRLLREKGYTIIDERFRPSSSDAKASETAKQDVDLDETDDAPDPYPDLSNNDMIEAIKEATGDTIRKNTSRAKIIAAYEDSLKAASQKEKPETKQETPVAKQEAPQAKQEAAPAKQETPANKQ